MRYVNPLVEGSSPSPVTKAKSTGNTQETLRNEGFSMRRSVGDARAVVEPHEFGYRGSLPTTGSGVAG